MALNNNQQKFIINNRKKLSPKKIAEKINVDINDVNKFLEENPLPKAPKIFYVFLVLIPILFFVFLELGLRFFDYGSDTQTWVRVTGDRLGLNPDLAKRYFFNIESMPESIQDVFKIEKPENGFRVFILGGSSAAGYPFMPFGSFSRYVRKRLELTYPNADIEVVNLALTAVNTYTIRDIVPDVLKVKPDLILIYAGHNEYYGALGVGSLESLGRSRFLVNTVLALREYKTIEFLRNIIISIMQFFASDEGTDGTLMSKMAQEKSIEFNSDVYRAGIDQFEGNMDDILRMIKEENIPIIVSTLASNLKDQPPFISEASENYPAAKDVFNSAEKFYSDSLYSKADSLYRYAKDLDMLRFRAPEEINAKIESLSKKYNVPIIDADSLFENNSPNGITGDNLMVDHLHPTLDGFKLIGKLFFEKMIEQNYLPQLKSRIPVEKQDSLTLANYVFSELDSVIADYKIKLLKNDWPFIEKNQIVPIQNLIQPKNFVDSIALDFVYGDEEWEISHRKLAVYYARQKKYDKFIDQMELLINQYPFLPTYYNMIATELLKAEKYDQVYGFLKKRYRQKPDQFSTKWLGIIELSRDRVALAEKYLLESIKFSTQDPQVLYNLSGVYVKKKDYGKAYQIINSCLAVDPDFRNAKPLKAQLERALGLNK